MAKSLRQFWMGVLARAPLAQLEHKWAEYYPRPDYRYLRAPEIGLVLARGRISGTGAEFNLGEVTMTRCIVKLTDGQAGFGYTRGRSKRHAELAAALDALLQDHALQTALMETVIYPLHQHWRAEQTAKAGEVASTKVDFFTMVRGD